ncbi:MAG: hypothetical protein PHX78_02235 [bacterium]|nr:hypothetical protein [bacterium]
MKFRLFLFIYFFLTSDISADPLDNWYWRNPLPQGHSLNSVCYGNNVFVAVGQFGTILTSGDGVKWSIRNSGVNDELKSITYGNDKFVVVSWTGIILTSKDGVNWSRLSLGAYGNLFNAITFGNNIFAVVGQSGKIFTSTDGISWLDRSIGVNENFMDVTYGNNKFIAVGGSDTGTVITSVDGVNWSIRNLSNNKYLTKITYSDSTFAAVGSSGTGKGNDTIFTSVDGFKWLSEKLTDQNPDLGWQRLGSVHTSSRFKDITYGNNLYVAVGSAGKIFTSSDGIKWSPQSLGVTNDLRNIAYGNSTFVAVGNNLTSLISSDGVNWRNQGPKWWRPYRFNGIAYGNNIFVAVGSNGIIRALNSAFEWPQNSKSGTRQNLNAIACGNNTFVAVGDFGTILTSVDGIQWVNRISGTSNQLTGITYGNNSFVVVGWDRETRSGLILTSPDGIRWMIQNFEKDNYFRFTGVTYGNNKFVAAGYGKIFTSGDGLNWSNPRVVNAFFHSITYGNDIFVATGEDGETGSNIIITSIDAVNWKRRRLGTNNGIHGIIYGNSTFIAVGDAGTILQSDDLSGSRYKDEPLNILDYVYPKPVKLSNEFKIKIIFNKTIDTKYPPKVALIGNGRVVPLVEKGGVFETTSEVNDTYLTPDIVLDKDMAGEITIAVSDARDRDGNIIKNIADETFILRPDKGFNLDKPGNIIIEEGSIIFSPQINIKFNITDAEEMMITEDVTFKNSKWEPFNFTKTFYLSDNEGEKTIYFKFKDRNGNISIPIAKIITFIMPFYFDPKRIQGWAAEEKNSFESAMAEMRKRTNEEMEKLSPAIEADTEQKPSFTEEIMSENGDYIFIIDYEKAEETGVVRYTIKNKEGKIISDFTADVLPGKILITSDGEKLIVFGKNWFDRNYSNRICFYNRNGELIDEYFSEKNRNFLDESKISGNDKYFVLAYNSDNESGISFFDLDNFDKLWDVDLEIYPNEIKISKNGDWIIVSGLEVKNIISDEKQYKSYKIYLIDKSGEIKWCKDKKILRKPDIEANLFVDMGDEGRTIVLKEQESRYSVEKSIYEKRTYEKSFYKNIEGKITLDSTIDNIYELEKP